MDLHRDLPDRVRHAPGHRRKRLEPRGLAYRDLRHSHYGHADRLAIPYQVPSGTSEVLGTNPARPAHGEARRPGRKLGPA